MLKTIEQMNIFDAANKFLMKKQGRFQ